MNGTHTLTPSLSYDWILVRLLGRVPSRLVHSYTLHMVGSKRDISSSSSSSSSSQSSSQSSSWIHNRALGITVLLIQAIKESMKYLKQEKSGREVIKKWAQSLSYIGTTNSPLLYYLLPTTLLPTRYNQWSEWQLTVSIGII